MTNDTKVLANVSYALSSLAYMEAEVCVEVTGMGQEMKALLAGYEKMRTEKAVVEAGACLVANLAYSNEQVKETLRQMDVCPVLMRIFTTTLQKPDISTFKQIFRAFGNLSLSKAFTQQLVDLHFCSLAVQMTN